MHLFYTLTILGERLFTLLVRGFLISTVPLSSVGLIRSPRQRVRTLFAGTADIDRYSRRPPAMWNERRLGGIRLIIFAMAHV